MGEPFKNWFNPVTVRSLADALDLGEAFVADGTRGLEDLELKDRVRHLASALHAHLPGDYPTALRHVLGRLPAPSHDDEGVTEEMWVWPINHWVQVHGLDHPAESVAAIQQLTQRFSCEFAIRPYLHRDPTGVLSELEGWTGHPNVHVRRLVSEGTRPRLPWGMQLKGFIADPHRTLPLLEALKDDPELYVRRSVANHLNDISKDHPDLAADTGATWLKEASKERAWVVKHALRGLLKKGHTGALKALGYGPPALTATLSLGAETARVGEHLPIEVEIVSEADQSVMIDYVVHHQRANGSLSPKVFKWSTRTLKRGERLTVTKKHSLKKVTTRRYYPGLHRVELQINGVSFGSEDFELTD